MERLKGLRILLISPEPWEHIAVSKHHYALALAARSNEVFFLGPPGSSYRIEQEPDRSLWVLEYPGFPKGMRFFPAPIQRKRTRKEFHRLEELSGRNFDVLWSFDNSVFFRMEALPSDLLTISHIVDLNQDFQRGNAARSADLCLGTTPFIVRELKRYNGRVHRIDHAYAPPEKEVATKTLPGVNEIKAVYGGNLSIPYIDWEALERTARGSPEVDFVFIGPGATSVDLRRNPTAKWKNALKDRSNVHFIGTVSATELPAYYRGADLLLVAYREGFEEQVASPHKMMEYLGSGKPVVATYTACYTGCPDLIRICERNEDFPTLFARTVQELSYYRSSELTRERQALALGSSYEQRIREIEACLPGGEKPRKRE